MSAARRLTAATAGAPPRQRAAYAPLHRSHGPALLHHHLTNPPAVQQQQQHTASGLACARLALPKRHLTRATGSSGDGPQQPQTQQPQQPLQQPQHPQPHQQPRQQQPQQPASLLAAALRSPPEWSAFLITLFQQGALLGTLLDGIHSRVGLQLYSLAPVTLGPLHTSLLVPPLLGTFYAVLGLLAAAADNLAEGSAATAAARRRMGRAAGDAGIAWVALSFGALAASLALSAALYEQQQPPGAIAAVLAAVAVANWAAFDRTPQGAGLALLCGVGAPAAEVVLMAATHCWSYPRADVGGVFVSWVPLCYAFYTPAVLNLARFLWATCRPPPPPGPGAVL